MTRHRRARALPTALGVLALTAWASAAAAQTELLPPSATAQSVGLRLLRAGESLTAAPFTVEFRRESDEAWRAALPLRAVAVHAGRTLFAGSLLGLDDGTRYELRIRGDGGELLRARVRTRETPAPYAGRRVQVTPGGLAAALASAVPGDVLSLEAGSYEGPFVIGRSGTAQAPITLQARPGAEAVLRNRDGEIGAVITATDADHVALRNLTIEGHAPAPAIRALDSRSGSGSNHWVISGCLVFGGIDTGRTDWWIEDNMIVGRYGTWDGRRETSPGGTGVNAVGSRHVVLHNQISYFYDGINTAIVHRSDPTWPWAPDGPQRAVDIVGNLVFAARDDGIQIDHVGVNHRVDGNRVFWAFAGISIQDFGPGPVYATRNVITDVAWESWKLMGSTYGANLYNNSSVSAFGEVSTAIDGGSVRAVNNLFAARRGLRLGPSEVMPQWDHNAYLSAGDGPAVEWVRAGESAVRAFPGLGSWSEATGYEVAGIELDQGDLAAPLRFDPATPPLASSALIPTATSRLRAAGQPIPTVTPDGVRTPTIGALDAEAAPPRYGPRRLIPGAAARGFYVDRQALRLTTEPVGYRPLTPKEWIVRLVDRHNIPIPTARGMLGTGIALVLFVALAVWTRRNFH